MNLYTTKQVHNARISANQQWVGYVCSLLKLATHTSPFELHVLQTCFASPHSLPLDLCINCMLSYCKTSLGFTLHVTHFSFWIYAPGTEGLGFRTGDAPKRKKRKMTPAQSTDNLAANRRSHQSLTVCSHHWNHGLATTMLPLLFSNYCEMQNLHQAADCMLCMKQSFATAAGRSKKLSVAGECHYIKASCAAASQSSLTCG